MLVLGILPFLQPGVAQRVPGGGRGHDMQVSFCLCLSILEAGPASLTSLACFSICLKNVKYHKERGCNAWVQAPVQTIATLLF